MSESNTSTCGQSSRIGASRQNTAMYPSSAQALNVTSPTCFREIQDQTGFDVAGMFIDAVEAKLKGKAA